MRSQCAMALADSPFAALTIIVAPAVLTNASSVLSLGTGNRIARVVDRTRVLATELVSLEPSSPRALACQEQIAQLKSRARLLLTALRCFYASIGAFAAAALISVLGAVLAPAVALVFDVAAALGLVAGSIGVGGLAIGGVIMVRETQLAVRLLDQEVEYYVPARPPDRPMA